MMHELWVPSFQVMHFFCGYLFVLVVYLQQVLFVQKHPEGPGVQVLLLVRGSQELQQHQEHPKHQP